MLRDKSKDIAKYKITFLFFNLIIRLFSNLTSNFSSNSSTNKSNNKHHVFSIKGCVRSSSAWKTFWKGAASFLFLLILLLPFTSAQSIALDKSIYGLDDIVKIKITNITENISLTILSEENVYKYSGELEQELEFYARESGDYIVRLSDNGNLIDEVSFTVLKYYLVNENILTTDKTEYLVNEPVLIYITTTETNVSEQSQATTTGDFELAVISETEVFKYLDIINSPLPFIPQEPGNYRIELRKDFKPIATTEFIVTEEIFDQDKPIPEQENIITELIPPITTPLPEEKLPFTLNLNDKRGQKKESSGRVIKQITNDDETYDTYNIEIYPNKANIQKIQFNNLKATSTQEENFDLDEIDIKRNEIETSFKGKKVINSFFIDTSSLDYTEGTITSIASGTELWKCKDWDKTTLSCMGSWKKIADITPRQEYNITINATDPAYAETGVASINTKKPIYHPGETAEIIIVVLDTEGYLVSYANVTLTITKPDEIANTFSTSAGTITEISRGIYETTYNRIDIEGSYEMFVRATGLNVDSTMLSSFEVKTFYEFDILRETPVTINPWKGPFFSSINLIKYINTDNFNYTERLPVNFTVIDAGTGLVTQGLEYTEIKWINLNNNSFVYYLAKAPLVTPDLYEIGPSYIDYNINNTNKEFTEARPWYMAIDPANYQVNATTCYKMVSTTTDNTYTTACSIPWNIDSEDGSTQNDGQSAKKYSGIQTTNDLTPDRCMDINKVDVCVDWWYTATIDSCIGVDFSATGTGGTWYTVANSSCPGSNGPLACSDVTGTVSWNCNSFSSANAAIRTHLYTKNAGTTYIDAVFFRIDYSSYPVLEGSVTNDGPVEAEQDITFSGTCSDYDTGDSYKLVVCNASVSTCDDSTTGSDLICKGTLGTSNPRNCTYTTTSIDIGTNTGDKAVCCDSESYCTPTPTIINDWEVTPFSGPPTITINSVSGDTAPVYVFTDQTPIVNATLNVDGYCYLSEFDENFTQMMEAGRVYCGFYTNNVQKNCEYTNTFSASNGTNDFLYMSCNNTAGGENNNSNNANMELDVLCDTHTDCALERYCRASTQHCELDIIYGYTCENIAYGGGEDNEVCGDGTNKYCVNDSTYSYTGWYCTADTNDCVYNNNGFSYDLGETLCVGGTNDYRNCSTINEWGSLFDCAEQYDIDASSQTATYHAGEYCAYYAAAQTCVNGISGGCSGTSTDCTSYIYNQTTQACGSLVADCDMGCGATCDPSNSTTPELDSGICYYDKTCSNACAWSENNEEAPDFCINDNNGGSCGYSDRTNPNATGTCYWNPTCADVTGASLTSGFLNNLKSNYCDYCTASGNQSGQFAPAPNASCSSGCADSETIYYDSGLTPSDRSDDCGSGTGTSTILSDTLTIGDIWTGSAPAYCDDTECDSDCGTMVGTCVGGAGGTCTCVDNDNPILKLKEPAPGAWDTDGTIIFTYNVTDISSGIENCSLIINGSINMTNSSVNESVQTQSFTQNFVNGTYNWSIICYDNSTNYNMNQSSSRIVGVDTTHPQLSNPNINGTAFDINTHVCLNVTVTDTFSGTDKVWAKIDRPNPIPDENITLSDDQTTSCDQTNGDNVYSVEYQLVFSGTYNWTIAYANDSASNQNNLIADLDWTVTAAGDLVVSMLSPIVDFEINESESNNNFTMTCNATCNPGLENCSNVYLFAQYIPSSDYDITTITTDLINAEDNFSCGDMEQGGTYCIHTFNITSGSDSGNNIWPIRCKAISSNSPTTFSSTVDLTINDHPYANISYPQHSTWITGIITANASLSFDSDGTVDNYLFEYDNNTDFNSPGTLCDGASATCVWNTAQQSQCDNNSMSCYLRVTIIDDNGLTNSSYILFGIDNQGPTTTLDRPINFENITTDLFTVNATSSDSETEVDTVTFEYRKNNTDTWTFACNDNRDPTYDCELDISSWPDGNTYEFRAYANDTMGNIGNSDNHTNITIDRTAPVIKLENPPDNNYTANTTVIFYYNVTDNTSTVADCSLIINSAINETDSPIQEDQTINFTKILAEGYYEWNINCTDIHGFQNNSETRNITIDITGPTATLDRPLSFENITGTSSYTINASVSDPGINNISMVTFEYRQNATDTWTFACNDDRGPTYDCEWNLIGLPDGNNYQVRAWANDTLGNNGSYSTHTSITIDNNPPNITLLLPPNENVDADGNVTLTYSVNDAAAGVANCTFIWNGEEDQINPGPILEDQELQFEKYNLVNGDYNWTINCTDVFGQIGTATNGPRNITVDIRYTMNVKVNSSKIQYEIGNQAGEPINISTNTTDFYNNPLNTLTKTDIILGNTTQPWWNTSWERRQPIYLTETSGQDRTNINIEVSVTGLSGYISSCTNEIRVASVDLEPVTVNIIEGDDSTYCTIVFQGDVSANANNEELYFVYFNNSNAPNPSYPALTGKYYNEFLDDFNTGTYPDTSKWDNPGNEWDINTQRAHTVRTNGYKLLSTLDNLINLSNYDSANLTFDWEVDASGLESDDCLKLDLYSGASWTNEVWKKCDDTIPTSGTQEITLSSIYLISTFRLRYGAATDANGEDMWIDNVNVTAYKLTDFNISGNTGLTQQHKSRQEDNTGEDGIIDFKFNSYSYLLSNYSAVSLASKSLYANTSNHVMFETIPDQTPPNITLNSPPDNGSSNSSVTFEYYVNDTTSTVLNCTLYLDGEEEDNETLIQEGPVQYFEPRIPSAGWHNWSVNCTDYYGNIGASEEWQIWIKPPDFRIISANITFNNTSPKEGESIRINATIYNVGGSDATNVTMQFWVGDPNTTGYQINSNFTANISDPTGDHSNASINVTWTVTGPGPFDIYVVADPPTETNGTILEINETNNKAYKTLHVPAYNYFYGSVQNNMYLSNIDNDDLYYYLNITQISGNIFVADQENTISFSALQAISRDINNNSAPNDFNDTDTNLSMTNYNDSIRKLYTDDTDTPIETISMSIFNRTINNVPVINSTNTTNFQTGILWDKDDGHTEYNGTQDLVFVTEINIDTKGKYGTYDFEIKIPVNLKNYQAPGTNVVFYWEIES